MPLYTKAEITIPGRIAGIDPQYIAVPITAARALDNGRANNVPDTYPNTATSSGGWVWINPTYEFAAELLTAYQNGTFTGGSEEVAGRGVEFRMLSDLAPNPDSTYIGAVNTNNTTVINTVPVETGTTSNANMEVIGTAAAGGSDSAQLTAYIEAELRAEVRKQYPELVGPAYENSDTLKNLRVFSVALSRAIKKYLNTDVKTAYLTLETAPVTLNIRGSAGTGGSNITPNPHSHPINPNPHRHDIVAP